MRVFIVDDDRDLVELMAMVIEDRGHDVMTAFNGMQAVDTAREQDFDLAFIDVRMPRLNGVESFLQILSFKPDARVVIMTGYSVEDLLEKARAHGALAVLQKPLRMPGVLRLIEEVEANVA